MSELFIKEELDINKLQKQNYKKNQSYYIINDFFQEKGKTEKTILEEYVIREASNLL